MTSVAAVLVLVVGAGEARSPATAALLATAGEALGPAASIRVREAREPAGADAPGIERETGADAVAVLIWEGPGHLAAVLRVHVARADRWTTRAISFSGRDAMFERGRTLGFAIASMWRENGMAETPPAGQDPPPPSAPTTAAAPPGPSVPPAPPPAALAPPASPAPVARPSVATLPRPAEPTRSQVGDPGHRFWVGIAAGAATGVGGPASAIGGGVEGLGFVSRHASIRLGANVRGGSLPELPGTQLVGGLAVGFEWWPIAAGEGRIWSLGVRADALGLWHRVRDSGADGQAETRSRLLPGSDLRVQGMVRVGPSLDVLIGAGPEVAMGTTDVRKGSDHEIVATIPMLRLVAEAGVRVGF